MTVSMASSEASKLVQDHASTHTAIFETSKAASGGQTQGTHHFYLQRRLETHLNLSQIHLYFLSRFVQLSSYLPFPHFLLKRYKIVANLWRLHSRRQSNPSFPTNSSVASFAPRPFPRNTLLVLLRLFLKRRRVPLYILSRRCVGGCFSSSTSHALARASFFFYFSPSSFDIVCGTL